MPYISSSPPKKRLPPLRSYFKDPRSRKKHQRTDRPSLSKKKGNLWRVCVHRLLPFPRTPLADGILFSFPAAMVALPPFEGQSRGRGCPIVCVRTRCILFLDIASVIFLKTGQKPLGISIPYYRSFLVIFSPSYSCGFPPKKNPDEA